MPKLCSLLPVSCFTATLIWSIACLVTLGCNQEKPQELNPPPESPSISNKTEANSVAVATQPAVAPPAPPSPVAVAPVPTTVPTLGPVTTPAAVTPTTEPIAVVLPPTTVPTSEPAAAPATNPADPGPPQSAPSIRSFTGTLHGGVVAAGSETTGWALHVDGGIGAVDVDVTAISGQVKALDGRHVTITGQLKRTNSVERGMTQLLIADTIEVAPLPDMNK